MIQDIDETLLQKLSVLARVPVQTDHIASRLSDFRSIVGYISQLDSISIPDDFEFQYHTKNVTRPDVVIPASASTHDLILQNFPARVDDRVMVPQVLKK